MPRVNAPAPSITGDVIRVTAQVRQSNQITEITCDYLGRLFDPVLTINISSFASAWEAACIPAMQGCLFTSSTITNILYSVVSRGDIATLVSGQFVPGTVVATTGTYDLQLTAVGQKATLLKGQHGRGRLEMMAIPVNFVTPGTDPDRLNGTGLAAYASFFGQLALARTPALVTYDPCVSTRPVRPSVLVSRAEVVTAINVRPLLGTQRRRAIGRGI